MTRSRVVPATRGEQVRRSGDVAEVLRREMRETNNPKRNQNIQEGWTEFKFQPLNIFHERPTWRMHWLARDVKVGRREQYWSSRLSEVRDHGWTQSSPIMDGLIYDYDHHGLIVMDFHYYGHNHRWFSFIIVICHPSFNLLQLIIIYHSLSGHYHARSPVERFHQDDQQERVLFKEFTIWLFNIAMEAMAHL